MLAEFAFFEVTWAHLTIGILAGCQSLAMAQKVQIPAMFVDSNSALAAWQMSKLYESKSRAHLLWPCLLYKKSFSRAVAKGDLTFGFVMVSTTFVCSSPDPSLAFALCNLQQCCQTLSCCE